MNLIEISALPVGHEDRRNYSVKVISMHATAPREIYTVDCYAVSEYQAIRMAMSAVPMCPYLYRCGDVDGYVDHNGLQTFLPYPVVFKTT